MSNVPRILIPITLQRGIELTMKHVLNVSALPELDGPLSGPLVQLSEDSNPSSRIVSVIIGGAA